MVWYYFLLATCLLSIFLIRKWGPWILSLLYTILSPRVSFIPLFWRQLSHRSFVIYTWFLIFIIWEPLFFLAVLGVELRAWHLLGTWTCAMRSHQACRMRLAVSTPLGTARTLHCKMNLSAFSPINLFNGKAHWHQMTWTSLPSLPCIQEHEKWGDSHACREEHCSSITGLS
jgi:hypothetical protein